jgi:hypothetical protein
MGLYWKWSVSMEWLYDYYTAVVRLNEYCLSSESSSSDNLKSCESNDCRCWEFGSASRFSPRFRLELDGFVVGFCLDDVVVSAERLGWKKGRFSWGLTSGESGIDSDISWINSSCWWSSYIDDAFAESHGWSGAKDWVSSSASSSLELRVVSLLVSCSMQRHPKTTSLKLVEENDYKILLGTSAGCPSLLQSIWVPDIILSKEFFNKRKTQAAIPMWKSK